MPLAAQHVHVHSWGQSQRRGDRLEGSCTVQASSQLTVKVTWKRVPANPVYLLASSLREPLDDLESERQTAVLAIISVTLAIPFTSLGLPSLIYIMRGLDQRVFQLCISICFSQIHFYICKHLWETDKALWLKPESQGVQRETPPGFSRCGPLPFSTKDRQAAKTEHSRKLLRNWPFLLVSLNQSTMGINCSHKEIILFLLAWQRHGYSASADPSPVHRSQRP